MSRREELWTVKVGKRIAKLKRTREQIAGLAALAEHARAVQVVKARDKWLLGGGYDNMSPDFQAGYHQACHHILADMQKGRA